MSENFFSNLELNIDTVADLSIIRNMLHLRDTVLNPLRMFLGVPIIVNSGYRDPFHNASVGGVPNSKHLCQDGYSAVDFYSNHVPLDALFYAIREKYKFSNLILERDKGIIHVDANIDDAKNIKKNSIRMIKDGKLMYLPAFFA